MKMTRHAMQSITLAVALAAAGVSFVTLTAAQTPAKPATPAAAPAAAPATFDTPQHAVDAAIAAASSGAPALMTLFGPDGKDLVATGDSVQDDRDRAEFVRMAKEKAVIVKDPSNAHRASVLIGNDAFPFAIPLVESKGKWMWDIAEGRYEILVRHVGANELDAITVCRGFVEAQKAYSAMDAAKTGVHEYAQRIISTPGKKDGLYWDPEPGGPESPVGEAVARAIAEGYTTTSAKNAPYHGYFFKVLTAQGKSAPLGEMDFVVQGHMIGGFALVAWPAQYRVSGVKTFMVGSAGVVYEKDLGPDTVKLASAITRYDPDKTWTATDDGR